MNENVNTKNKIDRMNKEWHKLSTEEVEAIRCVLRELAEILEEYWESIVVIGGCVPFFLIPQDKVLYEGTKDVDLVLDAQRLIEDGDQTIEEILEKALFQQDVKRPFRWEKAVAVKEHCFKVFVDFLCEETVERPHGSLQRIQDIFVSTMRGCNTAFFNPVKFSLNSETAHTGPIIQVASAAPFLAMKGLSLWNRDCLASHESACKDAYDIYYVIKNFPDGHTALLWEYNQLVLNSIMREGLQKIAFKWQSLEDRGPSLVVEYANSVDLQNTLREDVFAQVNGCLSLLT